MNKLNCLFFFLFAFTGLNGQKKINLEVLKSSLNCKDGLWGNRDTYGITGTVEPVTDADVASGGWDKTFSINAKANGATIWDQICLVRIVDPFNQCKPTNTNPCFCNAYNGTAQIAHFVVTSLAKVIHSNGTVQAEWTNDHLPTLQSKIINLPQIYDSESGQLTLYKKNAPASNLSESCGGDFNYGKEYTINLCCSATVLPCKPKFYFNPALNGTTVYNSEISCVSHTFNVTTYDSVNVSKSFTACNATDTKKRGSCIIKISLNGQLKIELSVLKSNPYCEHGLLENVDKYGVSGTIGPVTDADFTTNGWDVQLTIQGQANGSTGFQQICLMLIGNPVRNCKSSSSICFCNYYNATSQIAYFVVNSLANKMYSNGIVRAEWKNVNRSIIYSNYIALPNIYGINSGQLKLFINNVSANNDVSGSCGRNFIIGKVNNIELCCSDTVLPCTPKLEFNTTFHEDTVDNSKPNCESHTLNFTSMESVQVNLSSTPCNSTVTNAGKSCSIQIIGDLCPN